MPRRHPLQDAAVRRLGGLLSKTAPGAVLPGERALAAKLGCSRRTVRIALERLQSSHQVATAPGRCWMLPATGASKRSLVAHFTDYNASSIVHQGLVEVLAGTSIVLRADPLPRRRWDLAGIGGLAGLVVFGHLGPPPKLLARCRVAGVPLVVVACNLHRPCDTVCADFAAMSQELVRHIHARGHRSIAFIGSSPLHRENPSFTARVDGYVTAMRQLGLEPEVAYLPGDFAARAGTERAFRSWFQRRRPTCLYLSGPNYAAHITSILRRLGLSTPADISLAGFGASRDALGRSLPSFMSIMEPWPDIGRAAGARIIARLSGRLLPPVLTMVPGLISDGDSVAWIQEYTKPSAKTAPDGS